MRQTLGMQAFRHILLFVGAWAVVTPFLWMFTTSLLSRAETYTNTSLFPTTWRWENYVTAWQAAPFPRYYLNSFIMASGIVIGHVLFNAMAAYVFARIDFPAKNAIFVVLLASMMVPTFVTIIPAYTLVASLGWIDSYYALIVPRLADVFGIILLRQYFSTIPREIEDAAWIDGCGRLRSFWTIILPMAKPALATVAIFSFLFAWNDFLWPLLVTNGDEMRTVQVGLSVFEGRYSTSWNHLMAGTIMATIPSVIVFMIFQRGIVRGLTAGALKE